MIMVVWLFPRDHHFEVFGRHHQRSGTRDVAAIEQGRDVLLERVLPGTIERREGFVRRPVEVAENLYPVRRRTIAEVEEWAPQ